VARVGQPEHLEESGWNVPAQSSRSTHSPP